jgi:hypothetical protein
MKKNFESSPNYSIAKKLPRPTAVMNNPGPGRYECGDAMAVQKRLPSWGFGKELRPSDRQRKTDRHELKAGPGSFDPYKKSELKILFGKFGKSTNEITKNLGKGNGVPGPSEYTPKKPRSKNPECWGIKQNLATRENLGLERIGSRSPATYNPNLNLTQLSSHKWAFGKQQARQDSMVNRSVCHGDVAQILTINKSFDHGGVDIAHYEPKKHRKMIRHGPFHKDMRKTMQDRTGTNETVGPGTYDHLNISIEREHKQGFGGRSMLEKFALVESRKDNPGPGVYNTTRDISDGSRWSVPRQERFTWVTDAIDRKKHEWPGPEKYETNVSSVDMKK